MLNVDHYRIEGKNGFLELPEIIREAKELFC